LEKPDQKNPKVLNLETDNRNPPIKIPKKQKLNSKDILRINSQLITAFVKRELNSSYAKTLSYLCSNYIQNLQQTEIETKLEALEKVVYNKQK
jgi:hypothetical protein